MGVDRVVKEALREITGREFNSDELLGHQGVNLKNNTSNLNTQAVLNATNESRTTEDPVTQPVESVTETTRLTPLVDFSTSTEAPSTTRRPSTVKTTRTTPARKTTVKMTKLSTTAFKTAQLQPKLSHEHQAYKWVTPEEALQLIKVEGIKNDILNYVNS